MSRRRYEEEGKALSGLTISHRVREDVCLHACMKYVTIFVHQVADACGLCVWV